MIARAEHKERAKKNLKKGLSGMIGANALTVLFNSAAVATVGASVALIMSIVVVIASAFGILAGIGSIVDQIIYRGNVWDLISSVSILFSFAGFIIGIIMNVCSIVNEALSGVADFGNKRYYLQVAKNQTAPKITTVMDGFHDFLGIFWVYLYRLFVILLWQLPWMLGGKLLGMIPAIGFLFGILGTVGSFVVFWYKHYEYWAVPYIKADMPNLDVDRCMKYSKEICRGHVVDLLVLDLSFLGWRILNGITAGLVGFFYYIPYLRQTETYVYQELKRRPLVVEPIGADVTWQMGLKEDEVQAMIDHALEKFKPFPPTEPQKKVGMVGLSGMYMNAPFEFRPDENVVIGRDETVCNIVISIGGEQVSHKHCSIRYISATKEYEVIDYSSNGTLADGRKIPAQVPVSLRSGTKISLANDKNSFRLM